MVRRVLLALICSLGAVAGVVVVPAAAFAEDYSAPLTQAISDLPTQTEVRTGYSRDAFNHWVDADGDGCDTRAEVLIEEADDPVTVGSGCSLSGGRWFSYYDRVSHTDSGALDIDHMVPLAESWDSGSRSWTAGEREAYANDLADGRSLVGVTAGVNRSKGDQDPNEWMPTYDQCRYVREWVAVKLRWRLAADSGEKSALSAIAGGCTNATISVTRAR